MNTAYLFDVESFSKQTQRRYVVRPSRLSRNPNIERALTRLKETMDALPRQRPPRYRQPLT